MPSWKSAPLAGKTAERLIEVVDDVVDRFDADRQADHVGAGTGADPLFLCPPGNLKGTLGFPLLWAFGPYAS